MIGEIQSGLRVTNVSYPRQGHLQSIGEEHEDEVNHKGNRSTTHTTNPTTRPPVPTQILRKAKKTDITKMKGVRTKEESKETYRPNIQPASPFFTQPAEFLQASYR